MICEHCGCSVQDDALTCDRCGTFLGKYSNYSMNDTGVRAIRQGRVSASQSTIPSQKGSAREYGDYDLSPLPAENQAYKPRKAPAKTRSQGASKRSGASKPDNRHGVPVNAYGRAPALSRKAPRVHSVKRHHFNWMLWSIIFLLFAIIGVSGYMIYMRSSDQGLRSTARRNVLSTNETMLALAANSKDALVQTEREALIKEWSSPSAQSYLLLGQEYMDMGELDLSIISFRIADILVPENYDGLILLANAYELIDQDDAAEVIYLNLANNISTFRSEAYTALIRMYQAQDRGPEAADMMLLAYTNTDKETFRLQRKDYIPLTPQINLTAGRYQMNKLEGSLYLTSPQGYDIYYTTDDEAILPQDGILTKDGVIEPKEGDTTIRAVCVSGTLVSDPLSVTYNFFYPSPPAPKSNLAPQTYKKLREVSLRAGKVEDVKRSELAEMEANYTYRYTIDGSTPTEDSPIYDGTPIKLPSGNVTLKAVCINEFGKMSGIYEEKYKFEVKPYPLKIYSIEDVFAGFTLGETSLDEFKQEFGQPTNEVATTYLSSTDDAKHLDYPWGYAVFILSNNQWLLMRVEMNSSITTQPRNVGFGSTESEVTGVFKDFGQLPSTNGERGLYYDYPNVGKVEIADDGTRIIRYQCLSLSSKNLFLEYYMGDGQVVKMVHYSMP